jgi:hypothetical protein
LGDSEGFTAPLRRRNAPVLGRIGGIFGNRAAYRFFSFGFKTLWILWFFRQPGIGAGEFTVYKRGRLGRAIR